MKRGCARRRRVKQVPAQMPGPASSLPRPAAAFAGDALAAGSAPLVVKRPSAAPMGSSVPSGARMTFQGPVRRRLDLDRRLVGLELDQRLALAHALAGLFQPAQHLGRFSSSR